MGQTVALCEEGAGTLWWRENCFFHAEANAHYPIKPDELDPYFEAAEQVLTSRQVGPKRAPLLVDRSRPFTAQFGVRTRLAEWAGSWILCIAWCAPNAMAQVAADHAREVVCHARIRRSANARMLARTGGGAVSDATGHVRHGRCVVGEVVVARGGVASSTRLVVARGYGHRYRLVTSRLAARHGVFDFLCAVVYYAYAVKCRRAPAVTPFPPCLLIRHGYIQS